MQITPGHSDSFIVPVQEAGWRFGSVAEWETWRRWHRAGLPQRLYSTLIGELFQLRHHGPLDIEKALNALMGMAEIPTLG